MFTVPQEDQVDNGAGKPLPQNPPLAIVLHVGEVEAILKSLDPNKDTGPDEIPARILKDGDMGVYGIAVLGFFHAVFR